MQDKINKSAAIIINTFRSFRPQLLERYGNIVASLKADQSIVTDLDGTIEKAVMAAVTKEYSDFGMKGEETGYATAKTTYWIIDPIDGTTNYVRGLPGCTNMAACIIDGQTVCAIIYDFLGDTLYFSQLGTPTKRNGDTIAINNRPVPFIATYWGDEQMPHTKSVLSDVHFRGYKTAGYEAILLATGHIDGHFSLITSKEHDCRAPISIAEQAGAKLIPLTNKPVFEGNSVNPYFIGTPALAALVDQYKSKLRL